MDGEKTKAVAAIEAQMAQVPPGSYRHQVLEVARDFKNAWVSLGAHLTQVSSGALYKEWGCDFETYCQRELHIRKATAHKLTATYGFMQRHEPRLLERAEADPVVRAQVPAFEVVQVLSRAEERGQMGRPSTGRSGTGSSRGRVPRRPRPWPGQSTASGRRRPRPSPTRGCGCASSLPQRVVWPTVPGGPTRSPRRSRTGRRPSPRTSSPSSRPGLGGTPGEALT